MVTIRITEFCCVFTRSLEMAASMSGLYWVDSAPDAPPLPPSLARPSDDGDIEKKTYKQ